MLRYALGDRDETAEIHVGVGQGRLSSLLPATDFGRSWNPRIDAGRTVTVDVRRLDGLFDEAVAGVANPRIFLKLDTQGFDLKAFAGAGLRTAELLGMQSEVSQVPLYQGMPHLTDQLATCAAAGFGLTGVFPVVVDRPSMRVIEFDAFMVRTAPTRGRPAQLVRPLGRIRNRSPTRGNLRRLCSAAQQERRRPGRRRHR